MYEIFYFVRDTQTKNSSPMKRSTVYKNKDGNAPPDAFHLLAPFDAAVTKTVLLFNWEKTADPNKDPLTYNLVIATDSAFSNVVYRREGIPVSMAHVDSAAHLQDLTTYYWKVEAVDGYGVKTTSTEITWSFRTDNTNGFPGIITGIVFSDRDFSRIATATITAAIGGTTTSQALSKDGAFAMLVNPGTVALASTASTYGSASIANVTVKAGETITLNMPMTPNIILGDIDGDDAVTLADAIVGLKVMMEIQPSGIRSDYTSSTADVNDDKRVGIPEVLYILQKVAAMR
jgi:hypothetical protein